MTDSKKEVIQFLKKHTLAVVSTSSKDGIPESASVFYAVEDDFTFYFATREHSRKRENLASNPNIAILISCQQIPVVVQAQGQVTFVEDEKEIIDANSRLAEVSLSNEHLHWQPLSRLPDGGIEIIRVDVSWLRWLDLRKPIGASPDDPFEQIIP